jgi:8-oxo-dGTP diphosphatase
VVRARFRAGSDAAAAKRVSAKPECLPSLAFDHAVIVDKARVALKQMLKDTPVAFALLLEKFTLSQLQAVYEAVRETEIDKRNFRKEIAGKDWIKETGELERGPHRPAMLFTRM